MPKYARVVVTNVDKDGFFEIIVYDDKSEKVFQCKTKSFDIDLLP